MHIRALQQSVRTVVGPTVDRLGFDLVAVELVGGQRGQVLRLSIDGPNGVSIDDCTRVSHQLSPVLDEADPIDGAYILEVSSPGMRRPVQRREDFVLFTGFPAKIRLVEGFPRRRYTGILAGVDDDQLQLDVEGEVHPLALDTIEQAHLHLTLEQFEQLPEILGRPADGLPEGPSHDAE